jgi:NIMA (never in mitosis gene a)-related kinase
MLLKTIKVPKNLHYLTDRLPKPNYTTIKAKSLGKVGFKEVGRSS